MTLFPQNGAAQLEKELGGHLEGDKVPGVCLLPLNFQAGRLQESRRPEMLCILWNWKKPVVCRATIETQKAPCP